MSLNTNNKKVIVYTTSSCTFCHTVKKFLNDKKVNFQEIDLSQNPEKAEEIIQRTGQMAVPVIEIDNELIVGFDRDKILNLLSK